MGCVETLVSTRGLLKSFALAAPKAGRTWPGLVEHVERFGVEDWLAQALDAAAVVIAGAANVLGLGRVVITGSLTELAPIVMEHLAQAVIKGTMWARFGRMECVGAARRRTAGLIAAGIDRLVVPMPELAEATQSGLNSVLA